MATVYAAEDLTTMGRVALKVMALVQHERGTSTELDVEGLMTRFEREARLACSIETDHIVRVYEAGVERETGAPYMVMELLDGRT
jgi:serine/threonine-protein kinase